MKMYQSDGDLQALSYFDEFPDAVSKFISRLK